MSRFCSRVGLLAVSLGIFSLYVNANPITYSLTTTASGTIGASTFTNALVMVSLIGDTSTVAPVSGAPEGFSLNGFLVNPGTATVTIFGLETATFTQPIGILSSFNTTADFLGSGVVIGQFVGPLTSPTDVTGILLQQGPAFLGYDLASPLGPVSGTGGSSAPDPTAIFGTTGGNLNFTAPPFSTGTTTFTAVTIQNVGLQGGTTSAPVYLVGGNLIGAISGTISGLGDEDYYWFYWGGGAFSATASVTGASSDASYLFSSGVSGSCNTFNKTLNSADGFSGTISSANLAAGQYCIGLDANSANDPNFSLTFNTPVSGVPEPGTFVLLSGGLVGLAIARRGGRRRNR